MATTVKNSKTSSTKKVKKFTKRSVQIFSRHPSHDPLRRAIFLPSSVRACVRFGSHTEGKVNYNVELNLAESIDNSANKLRMKTCFANGKVKTAEWWTPVMLQNTLGFNAAGDHLKRETNPANLPYPLVVKHVYGSRGRGNTKIDTPEQLMSFFNGKTLSNYIIEKYYSYNREYRLHVTTEGYFYACRKMIRGDVPENQRWFRNDSNSVWITEFEPLRDSAGVITGESKTDNPEFDRPVNFKAIADECVKALRSVGLDFGACDVRVQSAKTEKGKVRPAPEFVIIEINSAPGLGTLGVIKYKEMIPNLINSKLNAK